MKNFNQAQKTLLKKAKGLINSISDLQGKLEELKKKNENRL